MSAFTQIPTRSGVLLVLALALAACGQDPLATVEVDTNSDTGSNPGNPADPPATSSVVRTACTPHSYPQRTNHSMAVDPRNHDIVYVGVEGEGFFKTLDGGATWQKMVDGIKVFLRQDEDRGCYSEFFATTIDPANTQRVCIAMAGSPGTPDVLVATNQGIYCSSNGGVRWEQRVQKDMNTAIYALAFDPSNSSVLYAGSNANPASNSGADTTRLYNKVGVVHKSTDGGLTWAELPTGFIKGTRVTAIHVDPSAPATLYASTFGLRGGGGSNYLETQYGVLKSTNGGASWTSMKTGLGPGLVNQALFRMDLSTTAPNRLIVTAGNQSYFLSDDGGRSFTRPTVPSAESGIARFDPHDPTGRRLLGLSERGASLVESLDGGNSWRAVGPLPTEMLNNGDPSKPTGVRPSHLAFSAQNPRVVYLSGSHASVYRSDDGGGTWKKVLGASKLPR